MSNKFLHIPRYILPFEDDSNFVDKEIIEEMKQIAERNIRSGVGDSQDKSIKLTYDTQSITYKLLKKKKLIRNAIDEEMCKEIGVHEISKMIHQYSNNPLLIDYELIRKNLHTNMALPPRDEQSRQEFQLKYKGIDLFRSKLSKKCLEEKNKLEKKETVARKKKGVVQHKRYSSNSAIETIIHQYRKKLTHSIPSSTTNITITVNNIHPPPIVQNQSHQPDLHSIIDNDTHYNNIIYNCNNNIGPISLDMISLNNNILEDIQTTMDSINIDSTIKDGTLQAFDKHHHPVFTISHKPVLGCLYIVCNIHNDVYNHILHHVLSHL